MLSTVFHRVKRQRRLGLSPSIRHIKFATTCVDLIKIRLGNFVCETESHFPLGGIFHAERHFLLFKDQLAESGRQKTKENIIPRGKFRLVENDPESDPQATLGLSNSGCSLVLLLKCQISDRWFD